RERESVRDPHDGQTIVEPAADEPAAYIDVPFTVPGSCVESFRNLVERFDRLVEIRRIRFRRAWFARPAREHIAARLAERHFLFLLPLVELHGDRERRLVEPGLRRRFDERGRA